MAHVKIVLNHRGVRELLDSPGIRRDLEERGRRVLAQAEATAPEVTGEYRRLLGMVSTNARDGRAAVRIGSASDHTAAVEAAHGTLAKALDAAG